MMTIENEHFNCMKMVSCKVTTIEHDDNRQLDDVGVLGAIMGVTGDIRGVLWAVMVCRYSGARRGIGTSGHWGVLGV